MNDRVLTRETATRVSVYAASAAAIVGAQALVLHLMGRVTICKCGYVKLWHGVVNSSENSQHIADWYSFTHIVHGFLLYWILWMIAGRRGSTRSRSLTAGRGRPPQESATRPSRQSGAAYLSVGARFLLAVAIEAAWEVVENTPTVINRYRAETISLDYFGDSVVNSVSDVVFCMLGFALARKLPPRVTVGVALVMEVALAFYIRDNLTLNVLMLLWPIAAIKQWQAGAGAI